MLQRILDEFEGQYRKLRNASNLRDYLGAPSVRADEEILTEPILRLILRRVLGFPQDGIFEQLGKSGRKPDFTPNDLLAHPFVLDAKSSTEKLAAHEPQIRDYMTQRRLDRGVLFNLSELRVYPAGRIGHDPDLSFSILPLWEFARGESMATDDVERFERFCAKFSYQELSVSQKIVWIAQQPSWSGRLHADDAPEIDVDALVERLRLLSRRLQEDAAAQADALDRFLAMNPAREPRLLDELRMLALEIAPGTDVASLPNTVDAWRKTQGLPERVWAQYLLRVAYLALTRILLYRAWEDVQLVTEYLHDGGFEKWYSTYEQNVEHVLREAFLHGSEQYPWLYGRENNYDWYRPREAALVEVLYRLVPEPLGRLDADVLGSLYATYVDAIDRDRLGQFYTPRDVVSFMLDRVGFVGAEGVFRIEGDARKPRQILDFATGSGGFLVEAARRVIDAVPPDDPRALREALQAVVNGFVGGEISPFPYYLTEVNLLLQVSRLLGYLSVAGEPAESFGALGILHVDTLTAKSGSESLDVDDELRDDRRELLATRGFDLTPLAGEKLETYRERLSADGGFDVVVGNPPYVAEANNRPLFERLRAIPAWRDIYRGKTDYLYYFLWLAVEKTAPGGRLCVITPAGWMNAGAAAFLREKLTSEVRIDALFLFGSYRLFAFEGDAPTPTVESAIIVATKAPAPEAHAVRIVALEDEEAAPRARVELLTEMAKRARGKPGRRHGIHVHEVPQSSLVSQFPWPIKHAVGDVAARVVAHMESGLNSNTLELLKSSWKVFQGIQTGADAYTARIQRRLPPDVKQRLSSEGATTGDPILELPAEWQAQAPWKDHPELLARNPEARSILYGAVDDEDVTYLIWLRGSDEPPGSVLEALERWRPVLASRAELSRNARRKWWETAWPRGQADMNAPKVIALYRTDRGRFALDETGEWQPSIKTTLIVGREIDAPVAYLCGVLNSELLDLWYAVRGKTPWHVRRNYEPLRMNEMPYRPPGGDPRAEEVAALVRKIAANRRALLPHRMIAPELRRVVKDPWKKGPVEIDRRALVASVPQNETASVRVDDRLKLEGEPSGKARRVEQADARVPARAHRNRSGHGRAAKARSRRGQHPGCRRRRRRCVTAAEGPRRVRAARCNTPR